jgi:glycerol-3-phosphate dehydrogenase (NAD(P)+)
MKSICILGAGSFGQALTFLLERNNLKVTLWGRNEKIMTSLAKHRRSSLFPKTSFLKKTILTSRLEQALEKSELLLLAVPTQAVRPLSQQIRGRFSSCPLICVAKGLEIKTGLRNSEVLQEELGKRQKILILSGPSHAEEIINRKPCSLTLACRDPLLGKKTAALLRTPHFRVYPNSDVIGVEIGGAVKNVIAIAAGLCDGLKLGDNAKAALIARGLVEIKRFGKSEGAKNATFDGLSGLGDLITTCFSPYGRNRSFGQLIAQGFSTKKALKKMSQVVEGLSTTKALVKKARKSGVEMPICQQIDAILKEKITPAAALNALMTRKVREES